jgi:hypothetical protein
VVAGAEVTSAGGGGGGSGGGGIEAGTYPPAAEGMIGSGVDGTPTPASIGLTLFISEPEGVT